MGNEFFEQDNYRKVDVRRWEREKDIAFSNYLERRARFERAKRIENAIPLYTKRERIGFFIQNSIRILKKGWQLICECESEVEVYDV